MLIDRLEIFTFSDISLFKIPLDAIIHWIIEVRDDELLPRDFLIEVDVSL